MMDHKPTTSHNNSKQVQVQKKFNDHQTNQTKNDQTKQQKR